MKYRKRRQYQRRVLHFMSLHKIKICFTETDETRVTELKKLIPNWESEKIIEKSQKIHEALMITNLTYTYMGK